MNIIKLFVEQKRLLAKISLKRERKNITILFDQVIEIDVE